MNETFAAIGRTVVAEFFDLHDVTEITRVTVRLLIAAALGYERERKGEAAGLGREAATVVSTLIALCTFALGSATFEWLGGRQRAQRDAPPDEVR